MKGVRELAAGSNGTCARARPSGDEEGIYCWVGFAHGDHVVPTRIDGLAGASSVLVLGDEVCGVLAGQLSCLVR